MKNIVKNFNNLIINIILKVRNKTNNKFRISTFNKFLITFIGILFLYIFYLLLPLLYNKDQVKNSIESKLLNEFKINLSSSNDISYQILPAPHFLIKDSKILSNNSKNQESIADIKSLKIFINQFNLFNEKDMKIKNVTISNANFSFLRADLKSLKNSSNEQFSNKRVKINKSNIFFKDNLDEVIAIIKIDGATLLFDEKKLLNLFILDGNIFTIPFIFELKGKNDSTKKKEISFKVESLNLDIFNESIKKTDTTINGRNIILFLNSKFNTEYTIVDKAIFFTSNNSKINNSKVNYNGELTINPFDINLNINLDDHKISQLFNFNPIFEELLKSEILFNDNISLRSNLNISSSIKKEIFNNADIYFNILNGKINFNKTKFIKNNVGSLELSNSNLFIEKNKLILSTDLFFDIKNSNKLFSALNTSKKLRKEIGYILINLEYDFLSNEITFNKVKINNKEVGDQFLNVLEGFNDGKPNTLNKVRRLLNELLNAYEG